METMFSPQPLHHFWRITIILAKYKEFSLACIPVLHTLIITIKEFSIEQLDCDDGKDEVKEKVDNEDIEHIFEWVDDTIKHSL